MTGDGPHAEVDSKQRYRTLPTSVPLDDTIESVESGRVPDGEAVRNIDQHGALRDD